MFLGIVMVRLAACACTMLRPAERISACSGKILELCAHYPGLKFFSVGSCFAQLVVLFVLFLFRIFLWRRGCCF